MRRDRDVVPRGSSLCRGAEPAAGLGATSEPACDRCENTCGDLLSPQLLALAFIRSHQTHKELAPGGEAPHSQSYTRRPFTPPQALNQWWAGRDCSLGFFRRDVTKMASQAFLTTTPLQEEQLTVYSRTNKRPLREPETPGRRLKQLRHLRVPYSLRSR